MQQCVCVRVRGDVCDRKSWINSSLRMFCLIVFTYLQTFEKLVLTSKNEEEKKIVYIIAEWQKNKSVRQRIERDDKKVTKIKKTKLLLEKFFVVVVIVRFGLILCARECHWNAHRFSVSFLFCFDFSVVARRVRLIVILAAMRGGFCVMLFLLLLLLLFEGV